MYLNYSNILEDSSATLTDFSSAHGYKLLQDRGFYKIIWAMEDVPHMMIDGCDFQLKKNQVLFCTPLNYIDIPHTSREIWSFVFNREFYCIRDNDEEVSCNGLLFYGSCRPVVISLDEREQMTYDAIYNILMEEFEYRDSSQGEMLRAMLKRLLIKSTRLAKQGLPVPVTSQETVDIVRQFNILVEKLFKTHHQVHEYAELLCRSPKTLTNIFKKHGQSSPLTAINERILLEARRLLLFSNKTAEEIAYELGYNEAGHFSKFFKKHKGCSPIEFKKKTLLEHKGKNIQF